MDKQSILLGAEYAFRDYPRKKCSPLHRIEVLDKARSGKWRVRFLDGPHAGQGDFVKSQNIIVPWQESGAFLEDEIHLEKLLEVSRKQLTQAGDVVSAAVGEILGAAGEAGTWIDGDGHLALAVDACQRILMRTNLVWDPLALDSLAFVDRVGKAHLPFQAAETLAKAFAESEPETIHLSIVPQEKRWERDARREADSDYFADLLMEYKAAWKVAMRWTRAGKEQPTRGMSLEELRRRVDDTLAKLWTEVGEVDQARVSEIQRLQGLIQEAAKDLRKLGADDRARELERSLASRKIGSRDIDNV